MLATRLFQAPELEEGSGSLLFNKLKLRVSDMGYCNSTALVYCK